MRGVIYRIPGKVQKWLELSFCIVRRNYVVVTMQMNFTFKPLACMGLLGITLSGLVACGGGDNTSTAAAEARQSTLSTRSAPIFTVDEL